jgi:hypothetical protein
MPADTAIHVEYLLTRLSLADHRLRDLEKYPVCNRKRIVLVEGQIKVYEREIQSAMRGY